MITFWCSSTFWRDLALWPSKDVMRGCMTAVNKSIHTHTHTLSVWAAWWRSGLSQRFSSLKCVLPENDDSFDIWHMLPRLHEPLDAYQGWTRQGRWKIAISLKSVSDMETKILQLYLSISILLPHGWNVTWENEGTALWGITQQIHLKPIYERIHLCIWLSGMQLSPD